LDAGSPVGPARIRWTALPKFRVALSADFFKPDGSPALADFNLAPLRADGRVELGTVRALDNVIPASELEHYDAMILLAHQLRRSSLPKSRRLGVVARFGVGYDSVDIDALADAGVATVITPGGVQRPVAVSILAFILALTHRLLAKDKLARQGAEGFLEPSPPIGVGINGKTLGTIGLGNIGSEMVRVMRPLGLTFIAYDPNVEEARARDLGVNLVDLETVFCASDILTINCPLTDSTRGLVNAERLAMMKPTAFLINTARGAIVDQGALTEALVARRIAGAGLDVFDPEPPQSDDPLVGLDTVVLAPHSVAMTDELISQCGALVIQAVLDVMHGREPQEIVSRRAVEHPEWRRRLKDNRAKFGSGVQKGTV
jgi:phosphoglycerate dehydrogenase-like enzyme